MNTMNLCVGPLTFSKGLHTDLTYVFSEHAHGYACSQER